MRAIKQKKCLLSLKTFNQSRVQQTHNSALCTEKGMFFQNVLFYFPPELRVDIKWELPLVFCLYQHVGGLP